jgi:hypothetical protein
MGKQAPLSSRVTNALIGYFVFVGVMIILFWLLFFTTDWLHMSDWECYFVWERSFPLADSWLALCCFLAAAGLKRRQAWGWLFGLLASSAAIFLALMDLLYSLENGIFIPFTTDSISELAIVLVLLLTAPFIIRWLWRNRRSWV